MVQKPLGYTKCLPVPQSRRLFISVLLLTFFSFGASLSAYSATATVAVRDISWERRSDALRCVITTESPIKIDHRDLIAAQGRFYLDLYNVSCRIEQPFVQHDDPFLTAHKFIGYPSQHVLRIVFWAKPGTKYSVISGQNPPRVIVECKRTQSAAPTRAPTPRPTAALPTARPTAKSTPRPPAATPTAQTATPRPAYRLRPLAIPAGRPTALKTATPPKVTPVPTARPSTPKPTAMPPSRPLGFSGSASMTPKKNRRLVVIDPGHGGSRAGATTSRVKSQGKSVLEKDINLQIALRLAGLIETAGNIDYLLTRKSDIHVSLGGRVQIAEKAAERYGGQALFVSIHNNSAPSRSANGPEFYFLSDTAKAANRELTRLENDEDYKEDFAANAKLRSLLGALEAEKLAELQGQSYFLCHYISKAFEKSKYFKRNNRGVKSDWFMVLRNFLMPAVLVEVGFMSNVAECQNLIDPSYQQTAAKAIFNGINMYFSNQDPENFDGRIYDNLER